MAQLDKVFLDYGEEDGTTTKGEILWATLLILASTISLGISSTQ